VFAWTRMSSPSHKNAPPPMPPDAAAQIQQAVRSQGTTTAPDSRSRPPTLGSR
jgi:hypothetical protein